MPFGSEVMIEKKQRIQSKQHSHISYTKTSQTFVTLTSGNIPKSGCVRRMRRGGVPVRAGGSHGAG